MTYHSIIRTKAVLALIIILSIDAFSQDTGSSVFSNVDLGSKKYYRIILERGVSYTARIVSVDNMQTLIMIPDGTTAALPTSEIISVSEEKIRSKLSVGLGYGVPYAGVGINVDAHIYKAIYLTAGLGTANFKMPLFDIGGKFYLRKGNYKWQPRLTANFVSYGSVYTNNDNPDTKILDYFFSPTVGIGQLWTFGISKSLGFDLDFHYVIDQRKYYDAIDNYASEGIYVRNYRFMKYTFSAGVRYVF